MYHKGGTVCVFRGCSSKTGGNISLFSIPKDPVRYVKKLIVAKTYYYQHIVSSTLLINNRQISIIYFHVSSTS